MHKRALELIEQLNLTKHPEGGYYNQTYCSENKVLSYKINDKRPAITDIYFLLPNGQNSKFHKVAHDEIWHFYEGDPLIIHSFDEKTNNYNSQIIGNKNNNPPNYKAVIKGGYWQAAQTTGNYTLVGCTVGAGFDFKDFAMLEKDSEVAQNILQNNANLKYLIV